jgi:hypothetical protein
MCCIHSPRSLVQIMRLQEKGVEPVHKYSMPFQVIGGVEKHHFGLGCLLTVWLPRQQQHSRWRKAAAA